MMAAVGTLMVTAGVLLLGLVVLGVLVAAVMTPARRLSRALGGLRNSLDTGVAPLRAGLRRRGR